MIGSLHGAFLKLKNRNKNSMFYKVKKRFLERLISSKRRIKNRPQCCLDFLVGSDSVQQKNHHIALSVLWLEQQAVVPAVHSNTPCLTLSSLLCLPFSNKRLFSTCNTLHCPVPMSPSGSDCWGHMDLHEASKYPSNTG